MEPRRRLAVIAHIHGLAAGSLAVLALFLAATVPAALAGGDVSLSTLAYSVLAAIFGVGAVREAKRWSAFHSRAEKTPPAQSS